MNGHDRDTTRGVPGADRDPPSPLDGLVGAQLGRRVRDLRVEVRGDGLVLHGRADSYHAKQLAQHAAVAATGLPLVANRIEVTCLRSGTDRPDGAELAAPPAGPPRRRVLIATGDDRLRSSGRDLLTEQGYLVVTASGGVGCVALLRGLVPDAVVLDTDLLWGARTASSHTSVPRTTRGYPSCYSPPRPTCRPGVPGGSFPRSSRCSKGPCGLEPCCWRCGPRRARVP